MKLPKGKLNECWSTHVQKGTKMKGGKVVPNCVPKSSVSEAKKDKIKIKLDPEKKIGYEVKSVGPGGKTTVTKRRDMPGKEDVGESLEEASKKDIADLVKQYNKIKGKQAKVSGSMVVVDGKKMKADDAAEKMAAAVMKMEGAAKIGTMAYYYDQKKRSKTPADAYTAAKSQAGRSSSDSQRTMSVKQKAKDDERRKSQAASMERSRYTKDSVDPMISFSKYSKLDEESKKVVAPKGFHWMKKGTNEYKLMKDPDGGFKPHEGGSQEADFEVQTVHKEDWQKVNRKDKTDGLSQKAVNAYRRENPGSKLKTAVTEKKPSGKRAARRKSFCSRMSGMKKRLTSAKTANDPDSRINKALRRWNC